MYPKNGESNGEDMEHEMETAIYRVLIRLYEL